MTCLRNIKYLTKKKVLAMQPIYYACFPIKVGIKYVHKPQVIKLEGDRLKRALDEPFFLYDDNKMFTTEQEAWDLLDKHNKFKPEPERKPVVNPFASEQIIRTIPEKGIVPLPIVGGQPEQKD